jgi:hypothetical protein
LVNIRFRNSSWQKMNGYITKTTSTATATMHHRSHYDHLHDPRTRDHHDDITSTSRPLMSLYHITSISRAYHGHTTSRSCANHEHTTSTPRAHHEHIMCRPRAHHDHTTSTPV